MIKIYLCYPKYETVAEVKTPGYRQTQVENSTSKQDTTMIRNTRSQTNTLNKT